MSKQAEFDRLRAQIESADNTVFEATPMEKINHLRRRLHVHSYLYYVMDTNLISDHLFDQWAMELVEMHARYPECVKHGYLPEAFADWTGATGMHLPQDDQVAARAMWLIKESERRT